MLEITDTYVFTKNKKIKALTGLKGLKMASVDLGKIGFSWKGVYDSTATYEIYDIVADGNNKKIYMSLKSDNIGNPVSDTTNWALWIDGGEALPDIIKANNDPTITSNTSKGTIWVNEESGEIFTCIDATPDNNVWKGQLGTHVKPVTPSTVDIFGDGSCIALYQLDGDANDTGGVYNGTAYNVTYIGGKLGQAANSNTSSQIVIPLNYNKNVITISFWFKWIGSNGVMPFGFKSYDLYIYNNNLGFNTSSSDLFGIAFNNTSEFVHIVAEFHEGNYTLNNIWINGVKETLSQKIGSQNTNNAVIQNTDLHIYGWGNSSGYRNAGAIDHVRLFNRLLTNEEVQQIYNEF